MQLGRAGGTAEHEAAGVHRPEPEVANQLPVVVAAAANAAAAAAEREAHSVEAHLFAKLARRPPPAARNAQPVDRQPHPQLACACSRA